MTSVNSLYSLLRRAPRPHLLALVILLLLGSMTEGIGIILLVPLLSSLMGGDNSNTIVQHLLDLLDTLNISATLAGFLLVFVALVALRSVIQFAKDRTSLTLQFRVVDGLRENCISQLMRADWRWITAQTRTDHMNLVLGEVQRIGAGLNAGLTLLTTLATAIAYFAVALVFSPGMAALIALAAAIGYVAMHRIRRSASRLGTEQVKANQALMANVQQAFTGLKLTKILGSERHHIELLVRTVGQVRRTQLKFGIDTSLTRSLQQAIGAAMLALCVYAGLEWLALSLAELLALTFLFARLMPLLLSAQQFLHRWLNAEPALAAVDRFIAESAAHAEPVPESEPPGWQLNEAITLRNVTLTFTGRAEPALQDLSLSLPARTTTAITGPSGSGKSTLADVLMGLMTPDEGTVEIDGTALDEASQHRWRRAVAYVPQDVFLFNDTVRANLLVGNPDASETDLVAALEMASAHFVFALPDGLETMVGDNGVRLSGGERQRLAIARALLRKPSLLILDEATSSLDEANEQAVVTALQQLHGQMAIVHIGHRAATRQHADQIVVLKSGCLESVAPSQTSVD
ncbi:MAG: ABC transporter ATP-binding protein [Minwuia sp.]|nr:ABC transporter ATP-binding protein [Minwuia sp.]